jgi:hypothetical protein
MKFVKHPHVKLAISLSGIFLVFLTFVVKDDYREGMRGRSEEISNAESTFLIRSEIEQLQDVVSHSSHQRDVVHSSALSGDEQGGGSSGWDSSWISAEESPKEIRNEFERYSQDVHNSEVTMDNIQRLIEGVPAQPEDGKALHDTRVLVGEFSGGMVELVLLADSEASRSPKRQKGKTMSSEALLKNADKLLNLYEHIMHNVDTLGWGALTRAESARATAERGFRTWNKLSYIIQGFGVVLGLLGLLLGVDVHI